MKQPQPNPAVLRAELEQECARLQWANGRATVAELAEAAAAGSELVAIRAFAASGLDGASDKRQYRPGSRLRLPASHKLLTPDWVTPAARFDAAAEYLKKKKLLRDVVTPAVEALKTMATAESRFVARAAAAAAELAAAEDALALARARERTFGK